MVSAPFYNQPFAIILISILALIIGPFVYALFRENRPVASIIDGFTLVLIAELVLIHLIPHTFYDIGWLAIVLALFGMMFPTLLEKRMRAKVASQTHTLTLIFALIALTLHTFADGFGLSSLFMPVNPELFAERHFLPIAIILHRLPEGLAVWWLVKPHHGSQRAILMLAIMIAATVSGFYTGQYVVGAIEHKYFGLFEAFIAGSLLHVIFHRHDTYEKVQMNVGFQWPSGVGALLGFGVIYLIDLSSIGIEIHAHISEPASIFLKLALKSAPALVFAYFASAMIAGFFPETSVRWLRRGSNFSQSLRGMAFGLPLPVCSCGVVPIYRTLIKQGVPLSAGLAFFVATPELGLDAILISIPLLGNQLTFIRVICAALVALVVGWQIGSLFAKQESERKIMPDVQDEKRATFKQRLHKGLTTGFMDVVEHTGPWILTGLIVAALAHPYLNRSDLLEKIPDMLEIPFFALLGMPVYVCAVGATPLVAVLLFNGVSPGAAIAFLLTGPATNFTTFGILSQLHGKKLALSFGLAIAVMSISIGYLVNFFLSGTAQGIHPEAIHQHARPYESLALIVLTLIFALALLRRGPRFLINQIVAFDAEMPKNQAQPKNCCH